MDFKVIIGNTLAVVFAILSLPATTRADVVTDWNEALLRAVLAETSSPCLASRNLAILHIAIFDAVNAATRTHQPYCFAGRAEGEVSAPAAAAAAAHRACVALYPSRRADFDLLLTNSLARVSDESVRTNSVRLGQQAGQAILELRRDDGASTEIPYVPNDTPGHWRRTPPAYRPPELPQWRLVRPFAMTNAAQFRAPPPPELNSVRYAEDVNELKRIGGRDSTERTPEQARIARFWSDFSYTVTPPGHWNRIAQDIARDRKLSLEANARLFALLNIAMADATIACWDAKYAYDFWRPVTAIQQAANDGNPATAPDTKWLPLLPTPPHPEYPSGHSAFSGAAASVLADVVGADKVSFTVGCDALPGVTRSYGSLWVCAQEIGRSRIYAGIHFPSACENGLQSGRQVGAHIFNSQLMPRAR